MKTIATTKCKSCQAEITWIETEAGKKMPLDAKPIKAFVPHIKCGRDGKNERKWYFMDTYNSHFATCPNANKHRKPSP